MKLIDGDALSETLRESLKIFEAHGVSVLGVPKALLAIVENAPTVDAEPVRHGRWNKNKYPDEYYTFWVCSVCGYSSEAIASHNYCPFCGAKMDGGERTNETT